MAMIAPLSPVFTFFFFLFFFLLQIHSFAFLPWSSESEGKPQFFA